MIGFTFTATLSGGLISPPLAPLRGARGRQINPRDFVLRNLRDAKMLKVDTLATIKALNECVGRSVSYTELRYIYKYHGGSKGGMAEALELIVGQRQESLEWDNRIGDGRRLEVWVKVKSTINTV